MTLYSEPPSLREFRYDKPTLLVCWWATSFCTIIILLRLAGRFIRTERLFTEDRIAALALIPLYLRMGCVHFILLYGTNNSDFNGVQLSHQDLQRKRIASGLVLASRFFYAATLWILKNTIVEFLRRLTGVTWERSWQTSLQAIRVILVATFIAVVISDLAECQPFSHYWQVLPDPGPKCRQGYAQLITMAVCNVLTDLLLVFFPIPIILTSQMTIRRKVQLVLLFSLSLSVVGVTLYRVPNIIRADGRQQYRSLLASIELLFATASANSLVLGSFVRDRGVKKQKFRRGSVAESFDRASNPLRRPTLHRHWGSDEDLVRDLGITADPELRDQPASEEAVVGFGPAPVVKHFNGDLDSWRFPHRQHSNADRSDDSLLVHDPFAQLTQTRSESTTNQRRVSFFDVGGLLDGPRESSGSYRRSSHTSSKSGSAHPQPSASLTANTGGFRRGSTALLQDLGGLLSPSNTKQGRSRSKSNGTELQTIMQGKPEPSYNAHGKPEQELMDPGGLLQ